MKTAGEVLGELLIGCLRALTPEEREELFVKGKFQGKRVEFLLSDEHEAVVIHFGEIDGRPWLSYKKYSTPAMICRDCGWQGLWTDLNVQEEPMDLTGKVSEIELFTPIIKTIIEKCVDCGSSRLKYYDYEDEEADLIIKGTFGDIGKVAGLLVGSFFHKVKQLFVVLGMMLRKQIAIKPFRRLGTAIKVSKLLTAEVSEDYKED
ncbi:MAG: hypothetical protein HWN66_12760 [Candidatus Helarchaeota archaeon]|nr:hypothetical protein [Candidatus Helarchaeota archaeon]